MKIRYRPQAMNPAMTPGTCKAIVGEIKISGSVATITRVCGREFTGPRNRKYCDEHSDRVQYTGKGPSNEL